MKEKIYGFKIGVGVHPIEVKETTEKKALIKLINKYWKLIDERESIHLLGELE